MKSNIALKGIIAALESIRAGKMTAAAQLLEATVASVHFPQAQRILKAVAEEVAAPDDTFDDDLDATQIGEDLREELQAARVKARRVLRRAVTASDEEFSFDSDDVADDAGDGDGDDGDDEATASIAASRAKRFQANVALMRRLKAARSGK